MKKWIVLGVLVAAAIALYINSQRQPPLAVSAAPVKRGDVIASVTNTRAGTVDACRRAGIAPATGGTIEGLYVSDGDVVKKGQLLLELWNADLKAQVTLAERDAAASKAMSRQACVSADVSRRTADRLVRLRESKVASEDEVERAVGEAEASAAACDASRVAMRVKDAAVELARATLERTQLHAPFDGVVAEINGELGEFVTPSPVGIPTLPTVDLIDNSCLFIRAPIDEVDAPNVKAGQKAWITLDAFKERRFSGTVRRVAPYVLDIEKQSRTVDVEAVIDDAAAQALLPGYSADVQVILEERLDVLTIPTSALLEDSSVYRVPEHGGPLEKRPIKAGLSNWEVTEVLSGLQEGDFVVKSVDREGIADGVVARVE
jgi:HlyD family secretion protein